MAQILVKSPVTSNGRDPIMKDGKIVYKETIVDERARPIFEKINLKLPTHLKKIIEPFEPNKKVLKKEVDVLEIDTTVFNDLIEMPEIKGPVVKKSKPVKRGPKSKQ